MTNLPYLVLFFPITLVILLVVEACRSDEPVKILRRALANLGVLSLVLVLGGTLVFLINRYL